MLSLATLTLLASGCSLFSVGGSSASAAASPDAGAGGEAPQEADAPEPEQVVDFSGLSERAAHPALARYKRAIDRAISADREEIAPMWGIDIGRTARTKTDPVTIYLYAASRSLQNGARLAEYCGALRLAEKLRGVKPLASIEDAATLAASLSGWSHAGQSEAEGAPGRDLEAYRAGQCVETTMERVQAAVTAAAELDPTTPHHRGGDVVHAWATTLAVAREQGSPWPVPEQATEELAAFTKLVRTGKPVEVARVRVEPVHPAVVLLLENLGKTVDPVSDCELLGRDVSDTARGSNMQAFIFASNIAMRTFPDLLETCDAKDAAQLARTRMPKALKKPEDLDRVFDALAPIFDDDESPERFCVSKVSYVLRETLSETHRHASHAKSGINQSLPYAEIAFARFGDLVAQAETTPEGRHALAAALLDETIEQLSKWKRRPAKDLRRYDD